MRFTAFLALWCASPALRAAPGSFIFETEHQPPIRVWTYHPDQIGSHGPVVMVLHGTRRNGADDRDAWIDAAERFGLTIITPEFMAEDFPGSAQHNLGGTDLEIDIAAFFSAPLTILLADADDDPRHRSLRRAPEAMAQGPHRFARGLNYLLTA